MIHQPGYIKILIQKYIENSITPVELERLKAAWKLYEEEELLVMTKEVLLELEEMTPDNSLGNWQPAIEKLVKRAQKKERKKQLFLYSRVAAACLILLLIAGYYTILRPWLNEGPGAACADTPANNEMPAAAFASTVRMSNAATIQLNSRVNNYTNRLQHIALRQTTPGVLTLSWLQEIAPADTTGNLFVEVVTGVQQQYRVFLPDGSSVYLNAGSVLRYPLINPRRQVCYVQLTGEAYIEVSNKKGNQLIVDLPNSQLQTDKARFAVLSYPGYTKTTLFKGSLKTFGRRGIRGMDLHTPGDQVEQYSYDRGDGTIKDSTSLSCNMAPLTALVWTKATRNYRNVSLRQFVGDMSRWCGFVVENLNCIPEQLRINTAICYRASQQQVYSEIRRAGIAVYEKGNMISFCNPAKENSSPSAQTAFMKKGKLSSGFPDAKAD